MAYRRCSRYLLQYKGNRVWIKGDTPQHAIRKFAQYMRIRSPKDIVICDVLTRMVWESEDEN